MFVNGEKNWFDIVIFYNFAVCFKKYKYGYIRRKNYA